MMCKTESLINFTFWGCSTHSHDVKVSWLHTTPVYGGRYSQNLWHCEDVCKTASPKCEIEDVLHKVMISCWFYKVKGQGHWKAFWKYAESLLNPTLYIFYTSLRSYILVLWWFLKKQWTWYFMHDYKWWVWDPHGLSRKLLKG